MKAADFATTGKEKLDAMQTLLQTEETNAVNSGLVGNADKSSRALKGALFDTKKGTAKAANGAVYAALFGRQKKSGNAKGGALEGEVSNASPKSAAARYQTKRGQKGSLKEEGASASTSVQVQHHLKASLKEKSKAAVIGSASNKLFSDTELEGADDLYYQGRGALSLAKHAKKRLRGKQNALEKKATLGALSEKKYQKKDADPLATQKKAQFQHYYQKTVYETAREVPLKKSVSGMLSGGVKSLLAAFSSAASTLLPVLIGILLLVVLISAIGGVAADEEQKKNASMEGMPSWVTYDLVLACLKSHETYGYPASALLGQMLIENGTSDEGSDLGRLYHNYGGIKYAGNSYGGLITGSVRLRTTEYTPSGTPYQTYASFAVFADDAAYMTYRCEHLYKQANYTRVANYQKAIDENDSELFLRALGEGGYYTDSPENYLASYRSICDAYPLVRALDSMTAEEFEASFGQNQGYTGGGQEYQSAEAWQKSIVSACAGTAWPGADLCATWTSRVYQKAGYTVYGHGNTQLGDQSVIPNHANYSSHRATTDLSQVKVGMLLSSQYGAGNNAGMTYGHVAIYIGDGMVMESVSTGIQSVSLSSWCSANRGWIVCGYPWDWR